MADTLLKIRNLHTQFDSPRGAVRAVEGVSLAVGRGRVTAIVGESGCGKTATALSILRLLPATGRVVGGEILFGGVDLLALDEPGLRRIRGGRIGMVFQEPAAALNPVMSIGRQIDEVIRLHRRANSLTPRGNSTSVPEKFFQHRDFEGRSRAISEPREPLPHGRGSEKQWASQSHSPNPQTAASDELSPHNGPRSGPRDVIHFLTQAAMPDPQRVAASYPHQLSGGMRQRAMIAMALAGEPELLIADEPTTALDVTVQAQILALLKSLSVARGLAMLLVTHDLGVVAAVADDVVVMYAGRIVESGPAAAVLSRPLHPYTQGLLRCVPRVHGPRGVLYVVPGSVPDPAALPSGCSFHPRCELGQGEARCREELQSLRVIVGSSGGSVEIKASCNIGANGAALDAVRSPLPYGRGSDKAGSADSHAVACWKAGIP